MDGGAFGTSLDGNGNIIVAGVLESGNNTNISVWSWDASGVPRWNLEYDSPYGASDWPNTCLCDDSGNTYVAGWYDYYGDRDNLCYNPSAQFVQNRFSMERCTRPAPLLLKIDKQGQLIWVQNNENLQADSLWCAFMDAVISRGRVVAVGHNAWVPEHGAVFAMQYDSYGWKFWESWFRGYSSMGMANSHACSDVNGNIYFTGAVDGEEGDKSHIFVASLDFEGRWRFFRVLSSGHGYGIASDSLGNLFVAASVNSDPKYYDFAVIKMDTAGNFKWLYQKDGGFAGYAGVERCKTVVPDNRGGVFALGYLYRDSTQGILYLTHLTDTLSFVGESSDSSPLFVAMPRSFEVRNYHGKLRVYDVLGKLVLNLKVSSGQRIALVNPGVYLLSTPTKTYKLAIP